MFDLHFCDNSLLTHFNVFQLSEDLGSDHKITITTKNLRKGKLFQQKSKSTTESLEKTHEIYTDHQISDPRSIQKKMN